MASKRKGISIFWLIFFLLTAGIGVYVWFYYKGVLNRFIGPMEEKEKLKKQSVKAGESRPQIAQPGVSKISSGNLTERQAQIIKVLSNGGSMTVPQIAKSVKNVSNRTVRRDMNGLVDMGNVAQEGSTKSTVYRYLKG